MTSSKIDKYGTIASTVTKEQIRQEKYGEGVSASKESAEKAAEKLVESYWHTGFAFKTGDGSKKYGMYVVEIYEMESDDEEELRWYLDDVTDGDYDLTVTPLGHTNNQLAVFWFLTGGDEE